MFLVFILDVSYFKLLLLLLLHLASMPPEGNVEPPGGAAGAGRFEVMARRCDLGSDLCGLGKRGFNGLAWFCLRC